MRLISPNWDEKLGVCTKHYLPQVPCPACMVSHDEDVEVRFSETDCFALEMNSSLSVRDLLPEEDGDWLMERVS